MSLAVFALIAMFMVIFQQRIDRLFRWVENKLDKNNNSGELDTSGIKFADYHSIIEGYFGKTCYVYKYIIHNNKLTKEKIHYSFIGYETRRNDCPQRTEIDIIIKDQNGTYSVSGWCLESIFGIILSKNPTFIDVLPENIDVDVSNCIDLDRTLELVEFKI